jgi:hypothetical protein
MKHLVFIAVALITVHATAQEQKKERQHKDRTERVNQLKDFSPEEIATLQTKKMALRLDLTKAQQREIQALNLEQAKARKAQMEARKKMREDGKSTKPTKEERFNRVNHQLDAKLATKAKLKTILNKEQFEKWERGNAMKGKQKHKMTKQKGQQKKLQKRRQQN